MDFKDDVTCSIELCMDALFVEYDKYYPKNSGDRFSFYWDDDYPDGYPPIILENELQDIKDNLIDNGIDFDNLTEEQQTFINEQIEKTKERILDLIQDLNLCRNAFLKFFPEYGPDFDWLEGSREYSKEERLKRVQELTIYLIKAREPAITGKRRKNGKNHK